MRVALSGLSMAEYFRDEMGQDVLLFVDNIFRFHKQVQVSALLGPRLQPLVISLRLQKRWVIFRNALLLPRRLNHFIPSSLCSS